MTAQIQLFGLDWFTELFIVFMIMCSYSFWWKRTSLFRLCTSLYVAASVAYGVGTSINNVIFLGIRPIIYQARYDVIIALVLGCLFMLRLWRKYAWISRWPIALMVGIGLPVALNQSIQSYMIVNVISVFKPFSSDASNILIFLGFVTTLYYFLFYRKFRQAGGKWVGGTISTLGRWFILLGFGVQMPSWAIQSVTNVNYWLGRVVTFIITLGGTI